MNPEGITILLFIVSCEVPNERNTIKTKHIDNYIDIGRSLIATIIKSRHGKAVRYRKAKSYYLLKSAKN